MSSPRLSALDASFLAVETPTAHMHVGWVALFSPDRRRTPTPSFAELRDQSGVRVDRAPRYRQKLASVPLGLYAPSGSTIAAFSIDRHRLLGAGLARRADPDGDVDTAASRPPAVGDVDLRGHREHGVLAIVGKSHHCMVDGLAAVELGSMLLDPTPEARPARTGAVAREPEPGGERILARGMRDLPDSRARRVAVAAARRRAHAGPRRAADRPSARCARSARSINCCAPAPASVLNAELSSLRRLAWAAAPTREPAARSGTPTGRPSTT